jgi:hypothetical protein
MVEQEQRQEAVSLKEGLPDLYKVVTPVPKAVIEEKNAEGAWKYGYNKEFDIVVISKTGCIGEVYDIYNLKVALPAIPDRVWQRHEDREEQYWEPEQYPKQLQKVKSIQMWNSAPRQFKAQWVEYIERQFEFREQGFWFMNFGKPTYLTGSHWMYLQWTTIDVGLPDFREANRILEIFWEACKADNRSFGMDYVKIRRSGFSYMSVAETANIGTLARKSLLGILSKTGKDARSMFTQKLGPIVRNYPFFFKPIQEGSTAPKTEISFRLPAKKITRKNMFDDDDELSEGLETTIDWRNTGNNTYDGEKLLLLVHDEAKKYEKPNNILESWRVQKTCLRIGNKITGKCMMGSTVNAKSKGGEEGKQMFDDSDVTKRNANGRTKSGLYQLFIPFEYNAEGFIDRYGWPVVETPGVPIIGIDGEEIAIGAVDWWQNEVDALKGDPDALNEFYRQNPRTVSHAFRDESVASIFNLTKLYEQIDYNDTLIMDQHITKYKPTWLNGERFTKVVMTPDARGRVYASWIPPAHLQNNVIRMGDLFYPGNVDLGAFGVDSYDVSATVDEKRASKAALIGSTGMHMSPDAPTNQFFCEYIARPRTAEICFEEMLMTIWFYGMPFLGENNKSRFLYWIKNAGMRPFSATRPDKYKNKLTATEKELGGMPMTSEDSKQLHAGAIETYIEKHVGVDHEGVYRPQGDMGYMPFDRTLKDWARFDINNRTRHDASIASGLSRMLVQKHIYLPQKKQDKIVVSLPTYRNSGMRSKLIVDA